MIPSAELIEFFKVPLWRLNNLYTVTDKEGRRIPFRMNSAQEALFHGMHNLLHIVAPQRTGPHLVRIHPRARTQQAK